MKKLSDLMALKLLDKLLRLCKFSDLEVGEKFTFLDWAEGGVCTKIAEDVIIDGDEEELSMEGSHGEYVLRVTETTSIDCSADS